MTGADAKRNDEDPLIHAFKNQLSVIVGFCDLLLLELPEDDVKRRDLAEIQKAAHIALDLVPQLRPRLPIDTDA
jgi:hypothetical protein